MKPKWVATQNAGKFNAVLLTGLLLLIISCDKSDDLETIGNESPINNESPPDNEAPTNDKSVIIYTDVDPDFISEDPNGFYSLDLNNDQIIDFTVKSDGSGGWEYLGITSNSNDANGILSVAPWYTYAIPLNSGQEIFALKGYKNGEFYATWGFLFECTIEQDCSPYWEDKFDGYFGLRFIINGRTHYGWVQLNVTSVTQWILMDYAYNATPDKPILAGQRN